MADPHTEARELSAGTVALQAWVNGQINSNNQLSGLQKLALGRVPLSMYGQIVTVVRDAIDQVRDNPTPPETTT